MSWGIFNFGTCSVDCCKTLWLEPQLPFFQVMFQSTLGTQLIAQHYSREFEREADLFAIELFVKQGRDLAALELLHEKLGSLDGSGSTDSSYLDSHPGAEERIQLIRENQ
ncbi:MAG: hypothetical protein DCE88_14415 [Betaproteobacteria bacterium]|nr:MAG: hypothetical protein DCE88_14415 [Betaproteobacteria bacterium]